MNEKPHLQSLILPIRGTIGELGIVYTSGTCALQLPTLAKAHVGTTFLKGEVGHCKKLVPSVESISYFKIIPHNKVLYFY